MVRSQIAWKDLETGEVIINEDWDTDQPIEEANRRVAQLNGMASQSDCEWIAFEGEQFS